jgi:ParB/RepB/Spo0J family partition protein
LVNELDQASEYREIPVSEISRSDESIKEGRGSDTDLGLESLMKDIQVNGLTHPPTVEATPGGPKKYRVIVGSRRLAAVEKLGMEKIKAFSENIHRRDYTALERAKLIDRMLDDWGRDETGLARALGYPDSRVIKEWLLALGLDPKAAELLSY